MKPDRFDKLLTFVQQLAEAKVHYRLSHHLEDAISVEAWVPGEHWEVDFFADGEVYVERFRSNGHVDDESVLAEFFAKHGFNSEPITAEPKVTALPGKSGSGRNARKVRL